MAPEERFERIETLLEETARIVLRNEQAIVGLIKTTEGLQTAVGSLAETTAHYIDASDARMKESDARMKESDARMRQIEERLEALIRIIAAEHSNGKGNLQ
jgi:hypothetical protein